jgi:hypothetical protein
MILLSCGWGCLCFWFYESWRDKQSKSHCRNGESGQLRSHCATKQIWLPLSWRHMDQYHRMLI